MLKQLLFTVCFLLLPLSLFAQGSLSGTVTDENTGDELPGASIYLVELERGASTNLDGYYTIEGIPAGTYTVRVTFVGYAQYQTEITVGTTAMEQNFELRQDLFGLEEIVVTGVLGDTESRRTPFSVGRVTERELELVPSVTPESALRGKVAGVNIVQGSGQPGSAPSVTLRGITTITGNNQPLYIVDGVILGSSSVDVESLDIESIEVVKGAAAASLYGSRAANGVINIRTKRGRNIAENSTRITVRNEFGTSSLENTPGVNQSHAYVMSGDSQAPYLDSDGNATADRTERVLYDGTNVAFMDRAYPTETFDNFDRFFNPGNFYTNYVSVAQRTGTTNYQASFTNTKQEGVLDNLDGYGRQNVRLNIDSRPLDNLDFSASMYYAKSELDQINQGSGSPFFGLAFTAPDINLDARDPDTGRFLIQPNEASIEENPLYEIAYNDRKDRRNRVLGSFITNYQPVDWINVSADFSYDRSNRDFSRLWPTFWEQIDQNFYEGGGLLLENQFDEAINLSLNATVNRQFGDLATRTQLRILQERSDYERHTSEGRRFVVDGVPRLDVTDSERSDIGSYSSSIRSSGYYAITNLDYDGKYIFDALVRRDGSSLFGPDERWQTYFRVSGAYRMSEEDWWTLDALDEFKLRASYGTAGGRPGFTAQYETWGIAGDAVTKGNLGNRQLKPEFAREIELGVELGLFQRFLVDVTYANTETQDQLLLLPLVSYFGFNNQWQNAGTVEADTWEVSLRAFAIQQRDMSLSFNVMFDKSTSTITRFDRPAQRYGPNVQGGNVFYRRAGEEVGTFYGAQFSTDLNSLRSDWQQYSDYFSVNDDGYMVPVGQGGSWQDGNWGSTVELPDGTELNWGEPVRYLNEEGSDFIKLGNALPDFSMSFGTNFRYKNLTLYALLDSQIGGEIYNQTRQWAYRDLLHPDQDQRGKAEVNKKPISYYETLYAQNQSSSHFVEDGSYVKLRELALRYSFDFDQLQPVFGNAVNRVTFSLIGRNLLTFTDYSGTDPEVGLGDATVLRFDAFGYPNYRTLSGSLEIQF
jgi:TonB-linked SusC/RagA family outer membrane protein